MTTNRRDFLKIAGVSALTLMTPPLILPAWPENVRLQGRDFAAR